MLTARLETFTADQATVVRVPAIDDELLVPDGPGWGVEVDPEWLATSTFECIDR